MKTMSSPQTNRFLDLVTSLAPIGPDMAMRFMELVSIRTVRKKEHFIHA